MIDFHAFSDELVKIAVKVPNKALSALARKGVPEGLKEVSARAPGLQFRFPGSYGGKYFKGPKGSGAHWSGLERIEDTVGFMGGSKTRGLKGHIQSGWGGDQIAR